MAPIRQSTPVEGVMRLALQAALRRDYDLALGEITRGGILTPQDIATLRGELPPFEIALWHVCFMNHALAQGVDLAPFELGRRFGLALGLAAADVRTDQGQAIAEAEALIERFRVYLEACADTRSSLPHPDDYALAMTLVLVQRVLPDVRLADAPASDRRLQVLVIGRDAYKTIAAAFRAFTDKWDLAYA